MENIANAPFTLDFEALGLPKTFNQIAKKSCVRLKQGEKAFWARSVGKASCGRRPLGALRKAKLILTRFSSVCPDYDGLVSSFKFVIDALVLHHVIKDDSMKIIGMPDFRWEYAPPTEGKIRVEVFELVERTRDSE